MIYVWKHIHVDLPLKELGRPRKYVNGFSFDKQKMIGLVSRNSFRFSFSIEKYRFVPKCHLPLEKITLQKSEETLGFGIDLGLVRVLRNL